MPRLPGISTQGKLLAVWECLPAVRHLASVEAVRQASVEA